MPKPLRSETGQPKDLQFAHFGVLDSGKQSKGSLLTAIITNVLLALIAIILGAAVHRVVKPKEMVSLTVPLAEKPPEPMKPPPPKIIPPKPIPKPPEPPKIKLPDVKVIEPPKPVAVNIPKPMPVITPAPPKAVTAAAAPKPTTVNLGRAASVVNNDPHPAAVSLGTPDNPIHPTNAPATASVNLGNRGMAGMPPGTGGGPRATAVNMGSGQPNGGINGTGSRGVQGVKLGVTGGQQNGTGNGTGTRPVQVAMGQTPAPPPPPASRIERAAVRQGPQVTYKPRPVYTAEATAKHIEGNVQVKIHVAANGAVTVIGVTSGLGYGLDQAAENAVRGTRFKPAVDANGSPIDWDGSVIISFQLAS